jgi:hypothetical protein
MPRTARIAPSDHIVHILTQGNNREDVFRDEIDYQKYLEILDRYKEKHRLQPIYQELSGDERNRRKKYRDFVKGMSGSKDAMRGEMERRAIYGSEVFANKLKKACEMQEIIKPIGRPKKEPT